ncbi:MAG: MacB family efflux pump subunit [Neisseria sp.]|nr:MacB family efflux pump subunit [Neisseria sp.]
MIEMRSINRFYGEGDNRVQVLKAIDLTIAKGEFIAIMGQSGSGKSTLMNILGCLDQASSGSYRIDGEETAQMDADALAALRRRRFGFIFQRYNLLPALSAADNVALPAVYLGMAEADRKKRAHELLANLGLADKTANKPGELSGGQQQRVSIARALMNGGEIILADEPTGALDSQSGEKVMGILQDLHRAGHTVLLVTHDAQVAGYAERIIEIKDGQIIRDDFRQPETQRARSIAPAAEQGGLSFYKDQFAEAFRMSIQAIVSHKLRSLLTMLGIIIGIASVVSIVALGRGSQEKILKDIAAMGTNTVTIYPGEGSGDRRAGRVHTLSVEDADALAQQSYVAGSTPSVTVSAMLLYRNSSFNAQLNGVGEGYFGVQGLQAAQGRLLTADDVRENRQVAVIDEATRKKLFADGTNPIGVTLLLNRRPLEVVGVAKRQSGVLGFRDDSLNLWSPYTTVINQISGNRHIHAITVKIKPDIDNATAERNINRLLLARHGQKDFFTYNSDSIKQMVEKTTNTMTLLISSIALISLIVGGIGVMNIMLVSVTERTREIGIRMAIGARAANILQQFLIEAVLICIIGGIFGVMLSFGISLLFNGLVDNFVMSFSAGSIILAVLCSTLIGVLFGFMPAKNASQLNPIDALSRE